MNIVKLLLISLFITCFLYGCGSDSSSIITSTPTPAANPYHGTMVTKDENGNITGKIEYDYFRIDSAGNVIKCSQDSQIDPNNYFYYFAQTGDSNNQYLRFADPNDYTALFQQYTQNYGKGTNLYEFLAKYDISPDNLYEIYQENPGEFVRIITFIKYLQDNYLTMDNNKNCEIDDMVDFLSYHNIKLSDFPSDPEAFFNLLKTNNLAYGDFVKLYCNIGNIPISGSGIKKYPNSWTPAERLDAIQTGLEGPQKGFILSMIADIALDMIMDILTDLITGTPTQMADFKEQNIPCYAKIRDQVITNSRYYSGGQVVSGKIIPCQYTVGALWWYNELNFTLSTVGTIKNIYDGNNNGFDDSDIANYGVFGRQITIKGTNVTANRVHDIQLKFKILDTKKISIPVPKNGIDSGFPSVDIALTPDKTPVKFIVTGEYTVSWKCKGFWGQQWSSDDCRYVKNVTVDTMQGISY